MLTTRKYVIAGNGKYVVDWLSHSRAEMKRSTNPVLDAQMNRTRARRLGHRRNLSDGGHVGEDVSCKYFLPSKIFCVKYVQSFLLYSFIFFWMSCQNQSYQNRYKVRRTESSNVSKVSFLQTHPSIIVSMENVTSSSAARVPRPPAPALLQHVRRLHARGQPRRPRTPRPPPGAPRPRPLGAGPVPVLPGPPPRPRHQRPRRLPGRPGRRGVRGPC